MYYTVYKTTNLVNGKVYIGIHKTENLEDEYLGSGRWLKNAINKYGKDKFKKDILAVFDNSEDMFNMESILVNEKFIERNDTYNISTGGMGALDYINDSGKNIYDGHEDIWKGIVQPLGRIKFISLMNNDVEYRNRFSKIVSESLKRQYLDGRVNGFKGKKHSKETKSKIGKANSIKQKGEGNSQYGTCWIYSEEEKRSHRICKTELNEYLTSGWKKGRKIKF